MPFGSGRFATSVMPWSMESHLSPLLRSRRFKRELDIRPASTSFCAACKKNAGESTYNERCNEI